MAGRGAACWQGQRANCAINHTAHTPQTPSAKHRGVCEGRGRPGKAPAGFHRRNRGAGHPQLTKGIPGPASICAPCASRAVFPMLSASVVGVLFPCLLTLQVWNWSGPKFAQACPWRSMAEPYWGARCGHGGIGTFWAIFGPSPINTQNATFVSKLIIFDTKMTLFKPFRVGGPHTYAVN